MGNNNGCQNRSKFTGALAGVKVQVLNLGLHPPKRDALGGVILAEINLGLAKVDFDGE